MKKQNIMTLPELLAPAGSLSALEAAIDAGADAVYMGCSDFNARIGAKNFTPKELKYAFDNCRARGIKTNVTLNTLVLDKEMHDFIDTAYQLLCNGADALIVADIGAASLLKKYFPEAELHASTQLSIHNLAGVEKMAEFGFSRVVVARELPHNDIAYICDNSKTEIEMFVHGALCVSQSGQCLASSLIGGRSGNRGLCAQPCRLPYNNGYPLSLKDSCLASHIDEILGLGVSSLKIEGRMKSPEYVWGVVKIYRRLLDERRSATPDELRKLAEIFSRSGFTDKYFVGKLSNQSKTSSMLGVRRESDKYNSRSATPFSNDIGKLPANVKIRIKSGEKSQYTLTACGKSATVFGAAPVQAVNAPLTEENVGQRAAKLGETPFFAQNVEVELDDGMMLPISELNDLRRRAVSKLLAFDKSYALPTQTAGECAFKRKRSGARRTKSARFASSKQIAGLKELKSYFDRIYLPLWKFRENCGANGVVLPPVAFDCEYEKVINMMRAAYEKGAKYALVSNWGYLDAAKEIGFEIHCDFRLNVCNSFSAERVSENFSTVMLSPELTLPQIRDVESPKSIIVYGRVPLMVMERCIIKDAVGCEKCAENKYCLRDRTNTAFPVMREFEHRNVMYNSVPVYMADKYDEIKSTALTDEHFIFSVETPQRCYETVKAYMSHVAPTENVRRIK